MSKILTHIDKYFSTTHTAPEDFMNANGILTFSDTMPTQQCFFINTVEDTINENTECLNVQISATVTVSGLTVSPSTAVVCISDDDGKR